MSSTQPNPTHMGRVGLGWTYVMGWVGLNFFWPTMVGWVKKSLQPDPTQPMHTPNPKQKGLTLWASHGSMVEEQFQKKLSHPH